MTRTFRDFDDYWQTAMLSPHTATVLGRLLPDQLVSLQNATRSQLSEPPVVTAHASAVSGQVRRAP